MSEPIETNPQAPGKIITFYSYKGGTGRSMALANIAWILASNGKRVLTIDWDLEAPGLHRYFHPFIEDKELTHSLGLIDWFVDVSVAARAAKGGPDGAANEDWWRSWTSLFRYTCSLDWDFPGEGTIDFVSAGRQGTAYAENVSSFDWRGFYEKLGGGVLLEALKEELRKDYDYVLIDSRTGISDTSGICTVQMPDDLVVCFTLNQQSMKGAAAAADSAWTQRCKPDGSPGLRIWPVPMRIELGEKERLEAASERATQMFQRYVMHLNRKERSRYWEQVQVLYQPFFAYEEVLAPFVERRRRDASLLSSLEALTAAITDGGVTRLQISERERSDGFARFITAKPLRIPEPKALALIYVSYPHSAKEASDRVIADLEARGIETFSDHRLMPGDDWRTMLQRGMDQSAAVVFVLDDKIGQAQWDEIKRAAESGKRVIPVFLNGPALQNAPDDLKRFHGVNLWGQGYAKNFDSLANALRMLVKQQAEQTAPSDPDDPQKGRWGGRAVANGRALSARVEEVGNSWYSIQLKVETIGDKPLEGEVIFHLHPTFPNPAMRVPVVDGAAKLSLRGWGAFTVGAEADGGRTTLELDLAADESFPEVFRSR